MTQSYETGKAIAELGAKQPHELLLMLGGVLTVLLTAAAYGIQWATPPGIVRSEYAKVATTVIVNLVFGGAFWAAAAMTRKNLMNGALTAGVVGIMLIYYGGQPG